MHETVHDTVHKLTYKDNLLDIHNSTFGFEKILVINMPDRVDKRDLWSLAGAATDINYEYLDGVRGQDMPKKAIPPTWPTDQSNATLGCYRGHLNAMQKIVAERISSALVFEDDADWDIMIKDQLVNFAKGARYIQNVQNHEKLHSPYGDDWDVLWVGYCGARNRPKDEFTRYWVSYDDPTVLPEDLRLEKRRDRFIDDSNPVFAGNFTRIIFEPSDLRCMYAYAVSLRGAERFLYHYSAEPRSTTADRAWSGFCTFRLSDSRCISPFPSLFSPYLAPGDTSRDSDRNPTKTPVFRKQGVSPNLVFPVKSGLKNYVQQRREYTSQYPDDTMLKVIDPTTYLLSEGSGVQLTPDDFESLKQPH